MQQGLYLKLRIFPTRVQPKKGLSQWSGLTSRSKAGKVMLCPGWGFVEQIQLTATFLLSGGEQHKFTQTHPNPHIPTRPILALSQADLSLTSALFYGLDSLFSLKSSPSFQAALQPGRRENIQTTQQMTQHSLSPHSSSNANNPQPAPAVGFKICN